MYREHVSVNVKLFEFTHVNVTVSSFQASRRLLPKGKVPLMLGILESIDFQGTDAGVVLRDRTGKRSTL